MYVKEDETIIVRSEILSIQNLCVGV